MACVCVNNSEEHWDCPIHGQQSIGPVLAWRAYVLLDLDSGYFLGPGALLSETPNDAWKYDTVSGAVNFLRVYKGKWPTMVVQKIVIQLEYGV